MNRADQGKPTTEGVSGYADSADPGLAQAVAERARRTVAEARPGTPVADVARDDQTEMPIPAVSSARGATQTAGTPDHPNSGSERGRGDLRAATPAEVLAGLIEVGLHPPEAGCVQCENARRTAARILAAGWCRPVPPRVFFPGDTVPADVWTVDRFNDVVEPSDDPWTWHGFNPLVELVVPSPEQWQSTVDRARGEREAKHDG